MKHALGIAILALVSGTATVCITQQVYAQKSYVDPQYHKASYEDIQRPAEPVSVKVDVEFQRNGTPLPAVNNELRGHVERILRASGVFTPSTSSTPTNVSVMANNIADLAAARKKGFKTGLTFGAAGSMVDDNYEFACVFRDGSGQDHKYSYQHAIHTAIGRKKPPATDLKPTTPADAFGHVVEDVILNFLKDLQDGGLMPK